MHIKLTSVLLGLYIYVVRCQDAKDTSLIQNMYIKLSDLKKEVDKAMEELRVISAQLNTTLGNNKLVRSLR